MQQAAIDLQRELNKEQYAAVTAPDGPVLVLAAAGTGKTRTLVFRVAHLVTRGVDPQRILLLTFTNRAAREMLERAEAVVGPGVGGVWGGTFHHMANRFLRRHAPLLGYGHDFTILDQDDSRTLVSTCMKENDLSGRDVPRAAVLLSFFSSAANTETSLESVVEDRLHEHAVDVEDLLRVRKAYTQRKRKLDAMDFDDLLVNCLALLREHPDVLARYQEQFLHVLVDEYQDTNTIQAEIVDLLAAKHRNLLVVGDDFQSIYSWRGANFRNIMSFRDRFSDAQIHKLEQNYRSVPEILDVANACIRGNPDQYQKSLRATLERYRRPRLIRPRNGEEQAQQVLALVDMLRRDGHQLADIAVLYRAHFHAMELQLALSRGGLPYTITSGVRFFEQAHIKDVCAILRLLANPEDELAFGRLLSLLPSVGPRTVEKLWRGFGGRFEAGDAGHRERLLGALRPKAAALWRPVDRLMAEAAAAPGGAARADATLQRFADDFYAEHAANTFEDVDRRMDDIGELVLYVSRFESMGEFLSDVALQTNLDAETDGVGPADDNRLRLSTVHQAKGLEWPVVIILWLTDGMFPSSRSLAESEGGDAEERRLFYVAVTRAKQELCLCVPMVRRMRDGGVFYCTPSRFVEEIPQNLLENASLARY